MVEADTECEAIYNRSLTIYTADAKYIMLDECQTIIKACLQYMLM
jgi:hypothetical protein